MTLLIAMIPAPDRPPVKVSWHDGEVNAPRWVLDFVAEYGTEEVEVPGLFVAEPGWRSYEQAYVALTDTLAGEIVYWEGVPEYPIPPGAVA